MPQNTSIKAFLDSLDGFLKQMSKEAADSSLTDTSAEEELHSDTELDIPRDENVDSYDTGSYHDETEGTLDEYYHGHAGDAEENKDRDLDEDRYHLTDESPGVEEAGEGEVPGKRKPKELQDTESPVKVSSARLASMLDHLSDRVLELFREKRAAYIVPTTPARQEIREVAGIIKDAYTRSQLVLQAMDRVEQILPVLVKVAQEVAEEERREEPPEPEPAAEEKKPVRKEPEDVAVGGSDEDLEELLRSLEEESPAGGEEEMAQETETPEAEEERETPPPLHPAREEPAAGTPEEVKQAAVVASLFSQAMDYLGITPADLKKKARNISKEAAARLADTVSQFRRLNPQKVNVHKSEKYARLFRQFTDYIREIMDWKRK